MIQLPIELADRSALVLESRTSVAMISRGKKPLRGDQGRLRESRPSEQASEVLAASDDSAASRDMNSSRNKLALVERNKRRLRS
jgi:hypothetical protein